MKPIELLKPTKTKKGWRITSGQYDYTLEEGSYATDRETKKEKLVWRNRAYYPTISSSLRGFQEIFLRESKRSLPSAIDETIKIIRPLLKGIKEELTFTV